MGGYNGTPFTRLQTWWRHMPAFTGWLRDCEARLEAGRPVADVLWYLGDAVDHKPDENFAFPEGFRADYLNHDVLVNRLTVKDGAFVIPEGTAWRVLWVPDTRFLRPASKARLAQLAAAGGVVVYGGKRALQAALARFPKDVATVPALGDEPSEDFMWLHRADGKVDRYFVAAGTNGFRGRVTFRAKGPASIYDPVSHARSPWVNGTTLRLVPSQSVFVEFGVAVTTPPAPPRTDAAREIAGPWTLAFTPGWDAPASVTLDRLTPWCDISGAVRKGRNTLRVEVTGVWHNRVFYDQTLPEKARKTWALLHDPPRRDVLATLIPQGLLGPVKVE